MNQTGEEQFVNNFSAKFDSFTLEVEAFVAAELADFVNDGDCDEQFLEPDVDNHFIFVFLKNFKVVFHRVNFPENRCQSIIPVLKGLADIFITIDINQRIMQVAHFISVHDLRHGVFGSFVVPEFLVNLLVLCNQIFEQVFSVF